MSIQRRCVVLVLATIIVNLQLSDLSPSRMLTEAASVRTIRRRQHQQQHMSARDQLPEYYWQCPYVECPPVSDQCETVEFLVYAFQYRLPSSDLPDNATTADGQAFVSVHCESCRYCLDRPSGTSPRSRSRLLRNQADEQSKRRRRFAATETVLGQQCDPVQSCPKVSTQCRDMRPTPVLFAGVTCSMSCPACYDTLPILHPAA